jgi:hypothetical protein
MLVGFACALRSNRSGLPNIVIALPCFCINAQLKQENAAKANPGKAADKKEKNDAKRASRKESGSTKAFN